MAGLNRSLDAIAVYEVDADGKIVGSNLTTAPSVPDTSLSGTIAASGGTATVTMANNARHEIINSSTAVLWLRWGGTPAVNGAASFAISPGGSYQVSRVAGSLQILSTAANQTYTVNRFTY